ncbi:hypothetical protein EDC01DRAFT_681558, partial [Geopyxis carbonaria]
MRVHSIGPLPPETETQSRRLHRSPADTAFEAGVAPTQNATAVGSSGNNGRVVAAEHITEVGGATEDENTDCGLWTRRGVDNFSSPPRMRRRSALSVLVPNLLLMVLHRVLFLYGTRYSYVPARLGRLHALWAAWVDGSGGVTGPPVDWLVWVVRSLYGHGSAGQSADRYCPLA